MNFNERKDRKIPQIEIDLVEAGCSAREGHAPLYIGRDIMFSTAGLESYLAAKWEPVMYDAMVLAASVEFGDIIIKRASMGWARQISLRIPVHDPERWTSPAVADALHEALEFLTGDYWNLEFVRLSRDISFRRQTNLNFPSKTEAVLAYSDGLDSRAVAGILDRSLGDKLVRVRVGSESSDRGYNKQKPFTAVPYKLSCRKRDRKESSSRSRGFKFALISGIAAYLADAEKVIIPESGQGVIGPALITVGHKYPDCRNHPLFTRRMAKFINALLGTKIQFVFPRIWSTKGETLREFVSVSGGSDWELTRSCWRGNNWTSINGKRRQCGVCAACMLRRVSVHAAGLVEKPDTYIANNMGANTFDEAIDRDFTKRCPAFREYAIGGVLHMDHLAEMAATDSSGTVKRHATLIAPALGMTREDAEGQLKILLSKHAEEWRNYLASLGAHSFIKQWVQD